MATDKLWDLLKILGDQYRAMIEEQNHNELPFDTVVSNVIDYYENIINCMPGNVYWLDKNGITLGCNKNTLEMFGFNTLNEFKGLTFEDMGRIANWSKSAERSFKLDTLEVIKTGKPKLNIEEPPIPHSDGRMLYFLTSRVPIFDHSNNVIGVVGISIDITEKKLMETALLETQHKLEGMTLVSASIAHELRTPLLSISAAASPIKEITKELIEIYHQVKKTDLPLKHKIDNDKLALIETYLNTVKRETEAANTFINMLLMNLNPSIENPHETFHIINCVNEAINRYPLNRAQKQLIRVEEKNDFLVTGSRLLIIHILYNLIKNALYYIANGRKDNKQGYIKIWFETAKPFNKLYFKDTGTGISADILPHIFDRFFSKTHHGAGIGLTFCKMVMISLGGTITCESIEGEYTLFTLAFPVQEM